MLGVKGFRSGAKSIEDVAAMYEEMLVWHGLARVAVRY